MKEKTTQYNNWHEFDQAVTQAQRDGVFIKASSLSYEVTTKVTGDKK